MPGIEWVSSLDNRNFTQSMNEMVSQIRQLRAVMEAMGEDASSVLERMNSMGDSFKGTLKDIAALAGVSFSLAQVKSFADKVKETRAYFQDIESSMKVFLGDEEKALDFTKKLKDYAYYNMFDFSQLAQASKQMIAYGHDVDSIIPRLDQLSNVARGTNVPLMEMVNAYNKAKNVGGLNSQDLQSWAAKGLIVKDVLKDMGEVSVGTKVTFEQLNKVLDKVTGEGGMFHDLMKEQMNNISAEQGQLEDNLASMYNEIGEKYEGVIVKWYKMRSEIAENFVPNAEPLLDAGVDVSEFLIDHYKEIAKVLIGLIATYGEYRATLALTRAYENVRSTSITNEEIKLLDEEIAKYKELLPEKEAAKNADLAEMVAKKQLTEEDAKRIAAKRAELEQVQIDSQLKETNEEIIRLQKLKLDEDLQEKVATQELTLSQAQEVQSRRAVLVQLEKEIDARKRNAIAKLAETEDKKTGEISQLKQLNTWNQEAIDKDESQLKIIDKKIAKLEAIGGKEEEINELNKRRSEIIEHQISLGESIEINNEQIAKREQEILDIARQRDEITLRYGDKDERLDLLKQIKNEQLGLLDIARQNQDAADKDLNTAKERHETAKNELETLQKRLAKEQELNNERSKNGEAPEDLSDLNEQVRIAALKEKTAAEEEETAATKAQEMADKAQEIQERINNITEQENTVITGANTVSKKGNTVATQTQTFAQKAHNIAVAAGSKVTAIFSTMVGQAKNAVRGLALALESNPLGLFIGAITMALPWIIEWISGTDDVADATTEYGNVATEAASKVNTLLSVVESTSETSKAHKEAVDELVKTYDEYGIALEKTKDEQGNEIVTTDELRRKHGELVKVLREEAIERQRAKDIEDLEEEKGKQEKDAAKNAKDYLPDELNDIEKDYLLQFVVKDDEGAINQVAEVVKKVEEGRLDGVIDMGDLAKEKEVVKVLDDIVEKYVNGLGGKTPEAIKAAQYAVQKYILDLAKLKYTQDKAKESIDNAAEAVVGALPGKVTKPAEEAEKSLDDLFQELESLNAKKAEPEVKVNGTEKAAADATEAKDKVEELNNVTAEPKVNTDELQTVITDTQEAIDGIDGLSSTDGKVFVDNSDIDDAIQGAADAVQGVVDLDLTSADPEVNKEQIDAAIERVDTAIKNMNALDLAKAYPDVDLTGYNGIITKLLNIKKLLSDIAGQKIEGGEVTVNGKGGGKNVIGNAIDSMRKQFDSAVNSKEARAAYEKELRKQLQEQKKKNIEWRKQAHTDSQYEERVKSLRESQAKYNVGSEAYNYYEEEIEEVQKLTGKGRKAAEKKAAQDAKKRAQAAKKEQTEAEKRAADDAKRRQREYDNNFKEEENRLRQEQDTRAAIEKENIAKIKNEGEKKRKEEEEQHRLNIQAIDNRVRDMKKKRLDEMKAEWEVENKDKNTVWADTKEAKAGIAGVSLNEDESKQIQAERETERLRYEKILEDRAKAEKESLRAFLKEYGDYEQRKLALTEEYEEKMRQTRNAGERASLTMKYEEEVEKLNGEEFQQQIDWGGVFSSLEGHTKEYLEGLRGQLQTILSTGNLPVDQMAVIQEKLREINNAISQQGNMFTFVGDKAREYNRLQQEAADAQEALNKLFREEMAAIDESIDSSNAAKEAAKSVGIDATLPFSEMNAQLNEESNKLEAILSSGVLSWDQTILVQERLRRINEEVRPAVEKAIISEGRLEKARKKTKEATEEAKNAEDAAARTAAQEIADKFADAAQWVNQYLGDLPELLGKLGLDSLGEKAQMGLDAVNSAAGAAADFASGNYVGAALKAFNALDNVGNILGVGGMSDKTLEKDIEKLTLSNENLRNAIDALSEEMADASSLDIADIYKQQKEMLEQTEKNTQEMMQRSGAAYNSGFWGTGIGGSGSSNKKIDQALTAKDWEAVSKAAGRTITSASEFWTLSSKEMYQVMRDANAQWTQIMDKANDGTADAAQFMNDYIELWRQQEQLENQYRERWTSISFDSVKSSFLSALSDMDRSASDFSKDFTKYLFDAVMNAQVGDMLNKELQKWYEDFAKYMESGNGQLTDAETEALRQQWDNIVSEGMAMRDSIAKATGYDVTYKDQQATASVAEKITYDQAELITGILTAIQIAVEHGGDTRDIMLQNLQTMTELNASGNAITEEIRNMLTISNEYLLDIKKSNRSILEDFGERMDKIYNKLEEMI